MFYFTFYASPIGALMLRSDGQGLTGLCPPEFASVSEGIRCDTLPVFQAAKAWLDGYFSGKPHEIDFPLSPAGTDFQRKVWQILLTVPYGETVTYGAIARMISHAMSAQAVGQAVGKNPIGIIIPCHRCIGAKGQLTGYAWGTDIKKWLLRHEEETK